MSVYWWSSNYSLFQYLNQRYGMRPIFLEYQITTIQNVFKTSTLKLGAVCDVNSIQEQDGEHTHWEALYDKGSSLGYFLYDRFDKDPEQFSSNRFLDIGPYTNQVYLYKENMVQLREQLTFQVQILHIDSQIRPFVLFVNFWRTHFLTCCCCSFRTRSYSLPWEPCWLPPIKLLLNFKEETLLSSMLVYTQGM